MPPRLLPAVPAGRMDLVSINHADYVPLSLNGRPKNFKPIAKAYQSTAPLNAHTSYESDFPPRQLEPNPPAESLMRTTIPSKAPSTLNYTTTNQEMLRKWNGKCKPSAFREPPGKVPLFEGEFYGQSVAREDFNPDILTKGKPSTSCKKAETMYQSNVTFDGSTTNTSTYKLPTIVQREPLHLKKRSINNTETMEKRIGRLQSATQYRADNPGYQHFPHKRDICPPEPDKLQLFQGKDMNLQSEQQASYARWNEQPKPSTSYKKMEKRVISDAKFDGQTQNMIQFQRVPIHDQVAVLKDVNRKAAEVGYVQKDGRHVKEAQNFGGSFASTTTNKSEYFQFWKTTPRIRYGDSCEKPYQPSNATFQSQSVARASYIPLNVEPAKSFKPLDLRFQQKQSTVEKTKLESSTAYREHYPVRPLPKRNICPAELLLQQA